MHSSRKHQKVNNEFKLYSVIHISHVACHMTITYHRMTHCHADHITILSHDSHMRCHLPLRPITASVGGGVPAATPEFYLPGTATTEGAWPWLVWVSEAKTFIQGTRLCQTYQLPQEEMVDKKQGRSQEERGQGPWSQEKGLKEEAKKTCSLC